MSRELTNSAVTFFDSEVKQAYQNSGMLAGTVYTKNGIIGSTTSFPLMGKGLATQRTAPASDVIPMNIEHSRVNATLLDWTAPEYTDIFNSKEVNFDEVRELASTISNALGRRKDQIIIDALKAETNLAGTVTEASTGLLTVAKIREAKKYMDAQGVPQTGRTFVISASGLYGLLGEEKATSADYASVKALVSGEINTFLGFNFIMIEDRVEGGLALASNIRDGFAYHRDSIGLGIGMDITTDVDWIAHKQSWLSCGKFKAGAVARTTATSKGIVKVQWYEA